jgi:hypothetical protein
MAMRAQSHQHQIRSQHAVISCLNHMATAMIREMRPAQKCGCIELSSERKLEKKIRIMEFVSQESSARQVVLGRKAEHRICLPEAWVDQNYVLAALLVGMVLEPLGYNCDSFHRVSAIKEMREK